MKLRLVQTCGACPEQYDVFRGEDKVGYLRLRHGHFRAECHGVIVYTATTEGDGCFTADEQVKQLNAACRAITAALDNPEPEPEEPIYECEQERESATDY